MGVGLIKNRRDNDALIELENMGNMKNDGDDLVEMRMRFWGPYAVQMMARDIDVIERVRGWLPKIGGMTVEQVSPYEVLLHRVPRTHVLEIRGIVKAKVVDELGWKEAPSNVVSIGVVVDDPTVDTRRRGWFFRKPCCMYKEKTPGFVRLEGCPSVAALTGGTLLDGKVVLYLHGNDEDIYESRESLKPFMPPSCNLALVDYTGYGLSFGDPCEPGCYQSAHRLYDWIHGELGYKPEDILIVWYSLGSSVALELAQTCEAKAVLLLAPFYSGRQVLMDWYPDEPFSLDQGSKPFPSYEMITNVKCPVAVIHGDKDETCLCVRGREHYENAPNKAGFTLAPVAGHCDLLAKLGSARFREIASGLLAV